MRPTIPYAAAAEFEPLWKGCRTPVDGAVCAHPQGLAPGAHRCRRSQIGELPGDEPGVRPCGRRNRRANQSALEVQNAQSPSKISQGTS